MNSGNIDMSGRTSKSRRVDTYLEIALSLTRSVTSKTNPDKVMSISPGLFGQIFKIYTDHALMRRLAHFEERSRVYAAPKLSATVAEHLNIRKNSDGINTRFAAVNPFDPRVLIALTPEPFRRGSASVMTGANLSLYSAHDSDTSMSSTRVPTHSSRNLASPAHVHDNTVDDEDIVEEDHANAISVWDQSAANVPATSTPAKCSPMLSTSPAPFSPPAAASHVASTATTRVHSPVPRTPPSHRPGISVCICVQCMYVYVRINMQNLHI
jgi:hypothetical protein